MMTEPLLSWMLFIAWALSLAGLSWLIPAYWERAINVFLSGFVLVEVPA